ncbi:MAG: hypothetical protein LBC99_09965 [Spirochaetota bacterium]|jgi:hypothetical protein|nr:hypothetical protein [Spirochaetota bacterium]
MRKPLDDYMNDPDIIDEPMPLKEIHAIRLRFHDETKDMTAEEKTAYYNEGPEKFLERRNALLCKSDTQ